MEAENTTNNEHLKRMCNGKTSESVKMRLINEVRESIANLKDSFAGKYITFYFFTQHLNRFLVF